jgi:hypothetical protein
MSRKNSYSIHIDSITNGSFTIDGSGFHADGDGVITDDDGNVVSEGGFDWSSDDDGEGA